MSTATVLFPTKWRGQHLPGRGEGELRLGDAGGKRLAVVDLQSRLIVVAVDLGEPAVEEDVDDAFRTRGEMRGRRRERIRRARGGRPRQDVRQRNCAEAQRRPAEHVASTEQVVPE